MKNIKQYMARKLSKFHKLFVSIFIVASIATSIAWSIPVLNLRSTENFVILAGAGITGLSPFAITGDVGLSPAAGSNITGFDGSNVTGIIYVVSTGPPAGSVANATLLTTAKGDLTTAYNDAAGRTPVPTGNFLNPGGGNIGGLNLVPGLYKFTSAASIEGSDVTLTGSATDIWIFQIGTGLTVGSGIKVILAGGAQAANIFWQVGSSATLGTYSVFKGTILADQSVTLGTGASLDGRALAFSGAVTMGSGVIIKKAVLDNKWPIFSIDSTNLAFGDVNNGFTKVDTVSVTNIGTANLIISNITSSASTFTITPITATILPGLSKKFFVTFAPITDGLRNGKIYFNHNAVNLKDSISLSGTGVSPNYLISPKSLTFGDVVNGITKMDSVSVTNTGTTKLVITSIASSNIHFVETVLKATILPGSTQIFYIAFTPLTTGFQDGYIRFNFNATNMKDSVYVSGSGLGNEVLPVFSANLVNLDFGTVNSGSSKMDSVTITNTGTANLIIYSMYSSNVYYNFTQGVYIIPPSGSQKFYITFSPLVSGVQNGYFYFYNNATNKKDSIQISGTGIGNDLTPKFTVNTSNLDFGSVFVGTSKTKSIIVTNTGSTELNIWYITSSNDQYIVSPILSTIAPGTSMEFFITFTPLVFGNINSTIEFIHNAGSNIIYTTGNSVGDVQVITINEARELPIGTEFAIEGIVTRTLGSYTRIQDQTAALTIVQESGTFFDDVQNFNIQMGDKLRIQGRISEKDFLKVISGNNLTGYQRYSRLNVLPIPPKVTLSEIANNGEKYESSLITVVNMSLESLTSVSFLEETTYQVIDASDNTNVVVIRIGNQEDTEMDGMPFIGISVTFEGVLSQSSMTNPNNGYQLTPVLSTDLRFEFNSIWDPAKSNQYPLLSNYPNPFDYSTTIEYSLDNSDYVLLKVFDVFGNEVVTLVNSFQEAGKYKVMFSMKDNILSPTSNAYFYRLSVGKFISTKQMILLK